MTAAQSELLELGSDLAIRYRWFDRASLAHPAKLHLGLLQFILDRYTRPGETICDPMAGVGSLLLAATQQRNVILREIEPRWLELAHRNAALVYERAGLLAGRIEIGQADAREPWGITADHIIFSPPYGCETRANGEEQFRRRLRNIDTSRYSDRWQDFQKRVNAGSLGMAGFFYGRHAQQIGHFRGSRYWDAMTDIYQQAHGALRGHGVMALVLKDYIEDRRRVSVCDQTVELCQSLGFTLHARHARLVWPLSLWQRRRKERGAPIIEEEEVVVFRRTA